MKDEEKNIELTKEQLDEAAGGEAKKGYETVSCPYCGAEKRSAMSPARRSPVPLAESSSKSDGNRMNGKQPFCRDSGRGGKAGSKREKWTSKVFFYGED